MQSRHHQSIAALGSARQLTGILRHTRGAALLSLFVLTLAGCGSSATDSAPAANSAVNSTATATDTGSATATTPTATPTDTVGGASPTSNTPAAVDACTLLSNDEAAQFLGAPVTDVGPTSGVGESVANMRMTRVGRSSCPSAPAAPHRETHSSPEDLFGVEPKPVPELDGAGWDLGLGTVDFAAGERHNSVLVVSSASSGTNAQTATAVAVLIRDRIEAAS